MKRYRKDYGLSAEQLDGKYNPEGGGEHPLYTRKNWRDEVKGKYTLYGYWDWVSYQLGLEESGE